MMMSDLPDLQAGIWQHHKGPLYEVLGYAHDANQPGRMLVAYVGLMLDAAHTGPRLAVRDADDFLRARVHAQDGTTCEGPDQAVHWDARCDETKPRFVYLGPALTSAMLRSVGVV